jgi:hypothetical protein
MKDPETTNDHLIKLSGKAELPEPLEIGKNYEIKASGTIVSTTEQDKDDGSHIFTYKFEPVIVEIVNDMGKSIKAKDVRRKSQQLRSALWKIWKEEDVPLDFEIFYADEMDKLIRQVMGIV